MSVQVCGTFNQVIVVRKTCILREKDVYPALSECSYLTIRITWEKKLITSWQYSLRVCPVTDWKATWKSSGKAFQL